MHHLFWSILVRLCSGGTLDDAKESHLNAVCSQWSYETQDSDNGWFYQSSWQEVPESSSREEGTICRFSIGSGSGDLSTFFSDIVDKAKTCTVEARREQVDRAQSLAMSCGNNECKSYSTEKPMERCHNVRTNFTAAASAR